MAKKRLFILGASGFGRDMESFLALKPAEGADWEVVGFLDDDPRALEGFESDYRIISNIQDFVFGRNDLALLAISDPAAKARIYSALKDKVSFLTYIAPDVLVGKFAHIGEGAVIYPGSIVGPGVHIGRAVTINGGTKLGHDVRIGDFSSLMVDIAVGGGTVIGPSVFVGSGATIIPKRTIGEGARIGAGSVVIRNVRGGQSVFGNPARVL